MIVSGRPEKLAAPPHAPGVQFSERINPAGLARTQLSADRSITFCKPELIDLRVQAVNFADGSSWELQYY